MRPLLRWLIVATLAVVLIGTPIALREWPAESTGIGAVALRDRIQHSDRLGWSGEVRALGSLAVPVTASGFGDVTRLLGESSDLRVWWRGPTQWRVDRLRTTGEADILRDGASVIRWDYEAHRAELTPYSPIRLPDEADLVPSALAARMLAGARPDELTRLPAQRIAGHSAAGLRLVPSDQRSTISRVDVWADESSGLPLRVQVYADGNLQRPVLTTSVISLQLTTPARARVTFQAPAGVNLVHGPALDEAAGANAYAPFLAPGSLARMPRRGDPVSFGAVGVYGRGPTALLAVPLRDFVARGLASQLRKNPGTLESGHRLGLRVGPLSVLLAEVGGGRFLLVGTVTPTTLSTAADELDRRVVRLYR